VKLCPVDPEFDELDNPKSLLEEKLSYNYCSLSVGMRLMLAVEDTGKVYELDVLECKPQDSIWIVEAELDLDLEKASTSHKSMIQELKLGETVKGEVEGEKYAYYSLVLDSSNYGVDFVIRLEAASGDPDLYVDQQHRKPNRREHTWVSASTGSDEIIILGSDIRRVRGPFWIGVRGHKDPAQFQLSVLPYKPSETKGASGNSGYVIDTQPSDNTDTPPAENMKRCSNCLRWIPDINFVRHEAFCARTNFRCPVDGCGKVIRVADKADHWHCPQCGKLDDKTEHWHCPKCEKVIPSKEKEKHMEIKHTLLDCVCGAKLEMEDMVVHKEYECSLRPVECIYCNRKIAMNAHAQHEQQCGAHTRPCDKCSKLVTLKDMAIHYAVEHEIYEGKGVLVVGGSSSPKPQPQIQTQPTPLQTQLATGTQPSTVAGPYACPLCLVACANEEEQQMHILTSCPLNT